MTLFLPGLAGGIAGVLTYQLTEELMFAFLAAAVAMIVYTYSPLPNTNVDVEAAPGGGYWGFTQGEQ